MPEFAPLEMSAMNKLQIKWLALGAVSALAFVGCVAQEVDESVNGDVGGADVALDPVAGEVSVKLAIEKTVVNSAERVMVKVMLTNDSDHAVRLLSWYAPAGVYLRFPATTLIKLNRHSRDGATSRK